MLPGDSKVSEVFRSKDLDQYLESDGEWTGSVTGSSVWPVRQLLAYCIRSYMRYGYIMTDEELWAMRVSSDFKSAERPDEGELSGYSLAELGQTIFEGPCIECTTIPWEQDGRSNVLTVNLASMVLHILAANNPLIDWKKYPNLAEEKLIDPEHQPTLHEAMNSRPFSKLQGRQCAEFDGRIEEGALKSKQHAGLEQRITRSMTRNEEPKQPSGHTTKAKRRITPPIQYCESSSSSSTPVESDDRYFLSQPGTATNSFMSNASMESTHSHKRKNRSKTKASRKVQRVAEPQSIGRRSLEGVILRPRSSDKASPD
ncbi:MAG: hypothetical protein M1822_008560 [Bathelium mastoideum]|nr:MAG: hypothetical protein M1822_008560 [Bathelium mastoideum]